MQNSGATKRAYLATRILDVPLWAIFNMLPLILLKGLHATPFQLAVYIALKPIVSVFALYWSALVKDRADRLLSNIVFARILGSFPFFFFPFVESPWFIILGSAVYMTLAVGVVPAWMEILKRNLSDSESKHTFAWGAALGYLGGGVLPILFGWVMDSNLEIWRWIFPSAATVSLWAIYFQLRIDPNKALKKDLSIHLKSRPLGLKNIISPWISAWNLLREREGFAKYQLAFMFVGGGLMLIQPALYIFFDEQLNLSYLELAVALSLCKGVSYALASPLWAKLMAKVDIYRFSASVSILASFFPIIVLFSPWHFVWLYLAYIFYGFAQAGSELSWNMSGPIFARQQDSSPLTSVNVFLVGVRGLFFPILGSLLCTFMGSTYVLILGWFALFFASRLFVHYSKEPFFSET